MPSPTLVLPDAPGLPERLHAQVLVVRVRDAAAVAPAAARVRRTDNDLLCVLVDSPYPLEDLPPPADWDGIPVALALPRLGRVRHLLPWLPLLRDPRVRVLLPAGAAENLVALRVLASLGVTAQATFEGAPPDWAALTELATWALLGPAPHAPLDPFATLADEYDPARATDWGRVGFADPERYLHLDADGRVALTAADLTAGRILGTVPDALAAAADHPDARAARGAWRRHFAADDACARCAGWRVCRGGFAAARGPGCAAFFTELMDVIDQRRALRARAQEPDPWRP